jgi:hypothetical protein
MSFNENINNRKLHSLEGADPTFNILKYLNQIISRYITEIGTVTLERTKKDIQIDFAWANDLDEIAVWFNQFRVQGESDTQFRNRILALASSPVNPTVDAIQDVYEALVGLRPVIQEDFVTRVLTSGETLPTSEVLAAFTVQFNVDIILVFETRPVNLDGISVTVGHTTNIDEPSGFSAWHSVDDPTHQTDIADTLDPTTSIMTLTGDPYPLGTMIDVEYYITPLSSYDTIEELTTNLPVLEAILQLTKAAGVKTGGVELVKFLKSWFQSGGAEVLTITDFFLNSQLLSEDTFAEMLEQFSDPLTASWDNGFWNRHHWNQDGPVIDCFSYELTPAGTHISQLTIWRPESSHSSEIEIVP